MAGLFYLLRGLPGRKFKKAVTVDGTDGQPLIIPAQGDDWIKNICTRPFAVDWDGDGDLDLVVGNFAGTFYVFKGKGKGKFLAKPEEIKVGGQPLKIEGHHSDPFVVDWDGDGDLDLLSGSSEGGVQWAENRAGAGKVPELERFRTLIEHVPRGELGSFTREADVKAPSSCTRVWVDDFNSDGKLDVLVGDNVTLVSPVEKITEKAFKKRFDAWNKSLTETSRLMSANQPDAKKQIEAQQRLQTLYNERSEFMKEDRTGFVWVYLRK
jgi:hypothetical protein